MKLDYTVLRQNKVDTYEAPVSVPDYSTTVWHPKCVLTPFKVAGVMNGISETNFKL
jgi:hypothetical protein